jgi:hypothetical protein
MNLLVVGVGVAVGWAGVAVTGRVIEHRLVDESAQNAASIFRTMQLPLSDTMLSQLRQILGAEVAAGPFDQREIDTTSLPESEAQDLTIRIAQGPVSDGGVDPTVLKTLHVPVVLDAEYAGPNDLFRDVKAVSGYAAPAVRVPGVQAHDHLWDAEPSLWDVAQTYKLTRPLPAKFGVEGPTVGGPNNAEVTAANPQGEAGINLSNGKLKVSLWGACDQLTLSVSKTDVYERTSPKPGTAWKWEEGHSPRPVGQLLLLAGDFAGAAQPQVSTAIHNGVNSFRLTRESKTADLTYLSTRSDRNVIVIKADYAGLTKPVFVRVFSFQHKGLKNPQAGNDGSFFWVRQTLPAEKTFPNGFDYYFVAKVVGTNFTLQNVNGGTGLGASTLGRDAGSAATARIPASAATRFIVYATVVTKAETTDPLAEAKNRLNAAESLGMTLLVADNQQWYRSLYARRERGRIFTGNLSDSLKDILLPFLYQGSWQNRHTYMSCPDPAKYEGDACYAGLEVDVAPWYGLPCFNEELYTGDFVAGRNESISPYYVTLVNFWRAAWEKHAADAGKKGMYYLRGYVPPIKNDVYFSYDLSARGGNDWCTMGWSYKNVWDEFDYGGRDDAFLRDSVYPGLRNLADFFGSLVVPGSDGFYHIENSQLRENVAGRDAQDCVAAAKWFWKTAIKASVILNIDATKRATWRNFLDEMKPYYLMPDGTFGGIVEKGTVKQYKSLQHYIVNVTDEYNLESSPEDRDRAYNSCDHGFLGANVPHLLGRNPDSFTGGAKCWYWMFSRHPWLMYYAIKVLGIGINGTTALDTPVKKAIACWFEPERLCNSRSGTLFFFPCVPSQFDVAFKDFQARGGFLVTGELRNGVVTYAQIQARRTTECTVMNPWPAQTLIITQQPENTPVATAHTGEKYTFAAQAGKSYHLHHLR